MIRTTDLQSIIEMYVESRIKAGRAVSTAEAVRALRAVLPDCDEDDQNLADLTADVAVRNRQPVIFDLWNAD